MTYPTPHERDLMTAYLGGYIEQGGLSSIALDDALAVMRRAIPATVELDGMIASRILRRVGFTKSQRPADKHVITYRSDN